MILCKVCNAVRPADAKPCYVCYNVMTVSERAAAMLLIPERQFFENVLLELNEARRQFPTNKHLMWALKQHVGALCHCSTHQTFTMELVMIGALLVRLAVEGDPAHSLSLPTADDPLAELEKQLEGK